MKARRGSLLVLALLVAGARPAAAQPSGGPYGPVPQTYAPRRTRPTSTTSRPTGSADAAGTTLAAADDARGGDRAGGHRRRDRHARRRLPHGRPEAEPGDHAAALRATSGPSSRARASRRSGRRCATTCGGRRGRRSSRRSRSAGGSANREGTRTPLHRFNNDMVFVDGELLQSAGWEGELDAHSYYVDYETGQVYIGVDPTNRLVEITAFDSALVRTTRARPRQDVGPQGPGDPRDHVHAVRLPRARGRGQAQLRPDGEPTDEPLGPADPATYGKEVVGTTLENVTISFCSRVGRLLPRRRPRHSQLADQRHEHGGHLRHRLLRRAAGAEHLPAEQRRASSPATTRPR